MLRYAFFPEFKFDPTLLLWGDSADMAMLSDFLRQVAAAPGRTNLSGLGFCSAVGQTVMLLSKSESASSVRILEKDGSLEWEIGVSEALKFADMIDTLATSSRPGHHYLECTSSSSITVMVSCGEYPADLRP